MPFFAAAMRGEPCTVHGLEDLPHRLPMTRWAARADAGDAAVLAHCTGPTLDIGCGPGRMSEHLAARGIGVLGIDIVPEAVEQTRARGASALHRDVFDHLPGEGRWVCALLADGNIGIGGDPVALLRRVAAAARTRRLGGRRRRATRHGHAHAHDRARVRGPSLRPVPVDGARPRGGHGGRRTRPGSRVAGVHEHDGRWFVVLAKGCLMRPPRPRASRTSPRRCADPRSRRGSGSGSASASPSRS